jgi:hypothetical protein
LTTPGVGGNSTVLRLRIIFALLFVFCHERAQEKAVDPADQDRVIPEKQTVSWGKMVMKFNQSKENKIISNLSA